MEHGTSLTETDRRAAPRCRVALWVEETSDRELYIQRAADLSTGGIYIERAVPHPPGTEVKLRFIVPGQGPAIDVGGVIANVRDGMEGAGMGVQFTHLAPDARKRIAAFVQSRVG